MQWGVPFTTAQATQLVEVPVIRPLDSYCASALFKAAWSRLLADWRSWWEARWQ